MAYTLIHNGTVIDGNGGTPIADGAVLIDGEMVKEIGRKADITLPDADITHIDAKGGTILPGMIDSHVHLMLEGVNMMELAMKPFSLGFYEVLQTMRNTLDAGVTTVRDAGGADLGLKTAVEKGLVPGPRIQLSVTMLSTTGGHGDGWMPSGMEMPIFRTYPGMPSNIVDGPHDMRRKVREMIRAGADVIKLCATGGAISPTDHPEATQFSMRELEAAVEEADFRMGMKVMAHAVSTRGIKNAILAGIHSIEHGIFQTDETIELMVEHGTFMVPTLSAVVIGLEQAAIHNTLPDYAIEKARGIEALQSELFGKAYKAGVKIAMGTDAGVFPHGMNLRELDLMVKAGVTPMDAIVATTRTAAQCLGWDDRIGTLESGKLADIIVVKGDPLADIALLKDNDNIELVMKNGAIQKDLLPSG